MTYKETLDYLLSQLPMYQRIGPAAYKASLDNTLALSKYLGRPETRFRSIHIAGTNGKGSVAHMIASVLQEMGLKTGLATSPHLKDFRERMRVMGEPVPKAEVVDFVRLHKNFLEKLRPSFFEMTMAMTFDWFSRQDLDFAVIETGMGGRLDSSNIIQPEISVITNIGLDHTAFLGTTLAGIASEKAGIIKETTPVVIGRRQKEVQKVFEQKALDMGAPIYYASDLFSIENVITKGNGLKLEISNYKGEFLKYTCGLTGSYQAENILTVLAVTDLLARTGRIRPDEDAVGRGLERVAGNTGIRGRWQQIGISPAIICDTAHNTEGVFHVVSQLKEMDYSKLLIVFGMVDDKDRRSVLELLPRDASYYFCRPAVPRGLDAKELAADARQLGLEGGVYGNPKEALAAAKSDAMASDLIFVGGSTFVVAEVI